MHGKWLALVVATSLLYGGCKKTPTASDRKSAPPRVAVASRAVDSLDVATMITRLLAAYEWEPTLDRAAAVWGAFDRLDSRLQELRKTVAQEVGGRRAEAEIERIELQRLRESAMARFSSSRARVRATRPSQDSLTASLDSDGLRAANAIISGRRLIDGRGALTSHLPQTP